MTITVENEVKNSGMAKEAMGTAAPKAKDTTMAGGDIVSIIMAKAAAEAAEGHEVGAHNQPRPPRYTC